MRINFFLESIFFSVSAISCLCLFPIWLEGGDDELKTVIQKHEKDVNSLAPAQKGPAFVKLALAHLADQNEEKAFKTFLEALSAAEKKQTKEISKEEQQQYEEALKLYLNHSENPRETAQKVQAAYASLLKEHSDFFLLRYLIALTKANQGEWKEFFEEFYRSYEYFPEHYLAFKTKAVLHLKLMEKGRTTQERAEHQTEMLSNTVKAIEKNGNDTGLYKLMMVFAFNDEKQRVVDLYLNKIIESSILVPRSEIAFFVKQAVSVQKKDLAQRFLDHVRKDYQYSRVVSAAQEYLDNQQ
jgi:tetratricopeptide (TPR) repeat protein